MRRAFLKKLTKKEASTADEESQSDAEQATHEEEKGIDANTGFAELGGFSAEDVTGLLDEQPMRLHPRKLFYGGDQYSPEELHPYGVVREVRGPRRSRTVRVHYSEQDAKEKMDFKNLEFLNNYLSDSGLILSRRETRLTKQLQTRLERSVKLAQALALLPVLDRRMEFKRKPRKTSDAYLFS